MTGRQRARLWRTDQAATADHSDATGADATTERTSRPSSPRIQLKTDPAHPPVDAAPASQPRIVDDDVTAGSGQLRRADFLDQARRTVTATADSALAPIGRNTEDCPYLGYWLAHIEQQSATWLERTLTRIAAPDGPDARDLLTALQGRVQRGITEWIRNGQNPDVDAQQEFAAAVADAEVPAVNSGPQLKRDPAARAAGRPGDILSRIGPGDPLAGSVRAPMEGVLGRSLDDVRVHSGSGAAAVSGELGAHAFTLGRDIALGPSHRPGTPDGDALLAHELAHVVQQRDATDRPASQVAEVQHDAAEQQADEVAAAAVGALWGQQDGLNMAEPAHRPSLMQRALGVQSCKKSNKAPPPAASAATAGSATSVAANLPFSATRTAYAAATDAAAKSLVLQSGVASARARRDLLLRLTSTSTGPVPAIRQRIQKETGVTVDANPMVGVSGDRVEQAYNSFVEGAVTEPWVLLALWVKEGKATPITSTIPATSAANARSIWRSIYYYQNMGLDHFTHATATGGDNTIATNDADAAAHESSFTGAVAAQFAAGRLPRDISADINGELAVAPVATDGGPPTSFTVTPSTRFYSLSLLLADAYYRENKAAVEADARIGPNADPGWVYARWNMGSSRFGPLVTSAETHRMEPAYADAGTHPTITQWAFERKVNSSEYGVPRSNAIRFRYYVEVYRLIYEGFTP